MAFDPALKPHYARHWALIIGINAYTRTAPLGYARQDAEKFAALLQSAFGFPAEGITLLLDGQATQATIREAYQGLTRDIVGPDDRVVVFFAGHGATRSGHRGEVGFLVPVDGDPADTATLIRWDELSRGADLIAAKHILFVLDACFGGLILQRSAPPGTSRFLKQMLQRHTRQVLTAGKADEVVADAGGPRPGHSMFTGHLLDALEGNAASPDGVVSAHNVMAYVCDRVAKDARSDQTPHCGHLDGDGDFIFRAPQLGPEDTAGQTEQDILIEQLPAALPSAQTEAAPRTLADDVKDYLIDPRFRIKLDDLIKQELASALYNLREESFNLNLNPTPDTIRERLEQYRNAVSRLATIVILLARWGDPSHQPILRRILSRLAGINGVRGGIVGWIGLRWYPLLYLLYAGGIAALYEGNFLSLTSMFSVTLESNLTNGDEADIVTAITHGILEAEGANFFKSVPGHERNHVPRSEYMFKDLQPQLEDALFLGSGYENQFDRFEILYALSYADNRLSRDPNNHLWGPPGRFAYKYRRTAKGKEFDEMLAEAKQQGEAWPVVQQGLFSKSTARYLAVAEAYRDQILLHRNWA